MRTSLTLTGLAFTALAIAQPPQLGPGNFFQVGRSYLRTSYDIHPDTLAALVGADGPQYAIDLAWLPQAPLYTRDSISCVAAPGNYAYYPAYYDTANVMLAITDLDLGGVRQFLFRVANDTVHYVGGQPNGSGGTGDDLVFQRYPGNGFETVLFPDIVYGSSWTEPVDGVFLDASGSDDHFVMGTATTVADGAGSITLPDGTLLPHTLRLRTVHDVLDSNDFFGVQQRHDTLYTWWVDGWDAPLMTLPLADYGLMHGYINPLPFTIYERLTSTGIAPIAAEGLLLSPNPCTTVLRVGRRLKADAQVAVLDATGRVVLRPTAAEAVGGFGVEGLMPGAYVLRVVDEGQRWAQRFVRE